MSTELDERINPEALHLIRIGNDSFTMFGHKLIELLTNPSEVELCIGSVPQSWVDNPKAWFNQAEAQFTLAHIPNDSYTCFVHILAALPAHVITPVADITNQVTPTTPD